MLALKALLLFVAGFSNVIVALAVLLRDTRKLSNITYFAVAGSMAGWTIGIACFLLTNDPDVAFVWAKVYYFFPLLIGASLVLFAKSFPNYNSIPKGWYLPVVIGFLALILPLLVIPQFLTESLVYHEWGKEILLNKVHYLFYSIYLLSCFTVALGVMYKKGKAEKGLYAAQSTLFFRGFTITAFFGVLFNLILPWVGNYRLIWLGPLFTNVFIASVAYSIVRHRMFEVRLLVARSLGYLFSIMSLAVLFGLIAFIGLNRFVLQESDISLSQQVLYTLLAVIIAFTFQPLKRFFDKMTNKVFYRDAYDPQQLLDQLNQVLVSTIELDKLLARSSDIIGSTLKAEFCLLGIKEINGSPRRIVGTASRKFSEEDIELVRHITPKMKVKIIVVDELEEEHAKLQNVLRENDIALLARLAETPNKPTEGLGYIILGSKKSGNPYSSQDTKILEIIADELVIAIQNALRFEEIQNFNITLQQKVNEATRQLRATNEKLKQLDQTKDDFISMASHQLRTPLTSVKGYISMVMEGDAGKISPQQRKLLDQAFISSQRMVYLIADLLNVSRLRTGKFVIEPKPTNLAEVVEGEMAQLVETAKGKELELTYKKPKSFPDLMLDETKTRQVIMNFVDNAIYYTPSGGHIQVSVIDKPSSVEFLVVDDGMGVPKSEQHHLFNKFYRAKNARKARPDGTGLGLFMAKKVVVAQGGSIIFKSQEGKGSTFGFSFNKAKLLPQNHKTSPQFTSSDKT